MKHLKSSLKVISGASSGNTSRSSRESGDENREMILHGNDDELDEEEDEGYPEQFVCSICVDLLCKPCELMCGHTFCKVCLLKVAIMQQAKYISCLCPFCRRPFFFNELEESSAVVSNICNKFHRVYEERVLETIDEEQDLLKNLNKGEQIGGTVVSSAAFTPSNIWAQNQRLLLGLSVMLAILSCLIFYLFFITTA